MANLIITIIAIALVAAAALMGAYYGGSAFNEGQNQAFASTIMNQAGQIQAASQMAMVTYSGSALDQDDLDGTDTTTVVTGGEVYLSSVPTFRGTEWTIAVTTGGAGTATLTTSNVTAAVCTEIESQVGASNAAWTCTDDTSVVYTY